MSEKKSIIEDVRSFNRFYTEVMGLLNQHILESNVSLTEARVLFELHSCGGYAANELAERLRIDKSYLSRMITRFIKSGWIDRKISQKDNRVFLLNLTPEGERIARELVEQSNQQVEGLLANLSETAQQELQIAMTTIRKHLHPKQSTLTIRRFRCERHEADYLINRQLWLYEREYGLASDIWKAYVTNGVNQMFDNFTPEKDDIALLEAEGQLAGCIAIVHTNEDTAQLRFFFVEPSVRGRGAGELLIQHALAFCEKRKYHHVFLWTCSELKAARYIYEKYGFHLTQAHENKDWGAVVLEEKWERDFSDI